MDDPRRLLDDPDTSPLARSLLASAGDDGPSADHRSAAAKRLGIAAITLAGAGKAGGAAVASALWWKAGLVVVLIGSIIGIGFVVSSIDLAGSAASDRARLTRTTPAAIAPADSTPPPADLAPTAGVAPEEPPAPPPPVVEEPVKPAVPVKRVKRTVATPEVAAPVPPPEVPAAEPPPPVAAPPVQVDARRLAAEVALLDRARGALKKRDTVAALAALDEHRRDFHDGALVAEAEVVRIEALIQAKDHAAARAQAESFLARFPKSPLVRRVRSLVENLKETP